jgi:hypothetical protein
MEFVIMNDTTGTTGTTGTEVRTIGTVGDILDIFAYMSKNPNSALAKHMSTLEGARTRGSTTAVGLDALDPTTAVRRAEDQGNVSNGCVAYEIPLSAQQIGLMRPTQAAWSAWQCLEAGLAISRRESDHTDPTNPRGLELFIDRCKAAIPTEQAADVDFITVLVGPDIATDPTGAELVHTWYPGSTFARYMPELGIMDANAVKLHADE